MIMSQTKIFNFFPGSVHATFIIRILSSFANRYKHNYIPHHNGLYIKICNSRQKQCLVIDTCDVNDLGPAKFRTQADSGTGQISYYNRSKKDKILRFFDDGKRNSVSI